VTQQQKELAARRAADRIGVTFEEYQSRRASGERWCSGHRGWHPAADFPHHSTPYCRQAARDKDRATREREWREFRNWLLARVLVK